MNADSEIRRKVKAELRRCPKADEIEVTVREGVVTLTGLVSSYFARQRAETAANRLPGIMVSNHIQIRPVFLGRADSATILRA